MSNVQKAQVIAKYHQILLVFGPHFEKNRIKPRSENFIPRRVKHRGSYLR